MTSRQRKVRSGTARRGGPTVICIVDHSDQSLVGMSGTLASSCAQVENEHVRLEHHT
jgi:hypothetical protein